MTVHRVARRKRAGRKLVRRMLVVRHGLVAGRMRRLHPAPVDRASPLHYPAGQWAVSLLGTLGTAGPKPGERCPGRDERMLPPHGPVTPPSCF